MSEDLQRRLFNQNRERRSCFSPLVKRGQSLGRVMPRHLAFSLAVIAAQCLVGSAFMVGPTPMHLSSHFRAGASAHSVGKTIPRSQGAYCHTGVFRGTLLFDRPRDQSSRQPARYCISVASFALKYPAFLLKSCRVIGGRKVLSVDQVDLHVFNMLHLKFGY